MTEHSHSMWGGRFSDNQDSFMLEFGASIETDIRLLEVDIEGSLAWAEALAQIDILNATELAAIQSGLIRVRAELLEQRDRNGRPFDLSLEDVHMTIESSLTELIGEPGAKLHTGRSRNDQIALDERLYLLHAIPGVIAKMRSAQRAIVTRAQEHVDTIIAAYTHLQQAQPVRLGHYLMAWFWMLERDIERFQDALKRTDAMPLGSGAVAGSGFPVDRMFLAERLGFSKITANSIDATSDRDHIIETISASAVLMMHLSRIAEDLIIWSTSEFGFISLPQAFSTGSSMMPQKKNPDSLELVRGKTGRVYGDLMTILTVMKGLPFSYGKDMQEDKEPLFDSLDAVEGSLRILEGVVNGMTFSVERMASNIDPSVLATDVADDIVKNERIPFRQAHRIAGEQVKNIQADGKAASDAAAFGKSTDRRNLPGGTGKDALMKQIEQALIILDKERV